MWPKWLADTLDRASVDSRPHAADAKRQRVLDIDAPSADDAVAGARADDWEFVTGLRLHEGYGPVVEPEVEPEA